MSQILSDQERKALEEKKNDLITKAESTVESAKLEKRELTEDEAAEIAEIRDDVKKIKESLKLDDEFRELTEMEKKPDEEPKEEKEMNIEEKDRACEQEKRAVEDADRAAFEAYIRGGVFNERANNMDVTNNGVVIPETIANKIVKKVYDLCPILEMSTKYNVKGKLIVPYYSEDDTHIDVDYQTEFEEIASNVGKFTTGIELTGFVAGAMAKVSRSLINNAQFNIVDHVIDLLAEHIARFIEHELLIGTYQKVEGLSGLTNAVTAAAQNAITADEIVKLHDAIKDRYQTNAAWIMSSKTRTALRLLKDGMGRYLLQDDVSSPFGTTLLGKPVYVSDNMPEIAHSAAVIYYGDYTGLATKFTEDINIQVLRERFATQHADGIIGWFEIDAKVEDQQKIAKLVMA